MTQPLRRLQVVLRAGAYAAAMGLAAPSVRAGTIFDVQMTGLPPLYAALFAVANCPNVGLDERAFTRAARLYHLTPEDLTVSGRFGGEVALLDAEERVRLEDDRAAVCSVSRLHFAVPYGILIDRGPVVPHPLHLGPGD